MNMIVTIQQIQKQARVKHPGQNKHINGNLRLNDIVYLGAHNCAISQCYGWLYNQQNVTITEQFEKYGARHFKVPLHWLLDKGVPQIVIAHEGDGGSNCQLSYAQRKFIAPERAFDRLREIVDLAFKHEQEILILKLESKLNCNTKRNGTEGWSQVQIAQKLHQLLVQVRADQRAIFFEGNDVPTFQYCRQNKKNLLITIEPISQIQEMLQKYVHYSYKISSQVDWQLDPLKDVNDGKVCRGEISNPFLEIHLNPENALNQKFNIFDKNKYNSYSHVRRRFLGFNHHCKKMPNFIVADFVDQGDLSRIVDDINDIINKNGKFVPEQLKDK